MRDLREVGGREENAEHDDDDGDRFAAAEPLAADQNRADDGDSGVGGDDRAHDRDLADRERLVEGEVGEASEHADRGEPGQVAAGNLGKPFAGDDEQAAEEHHRHDVEAQHDPEGAGLPGRDRCEVIGHAPRQRGREAEEDPHQMSGR